MQAFPLERYAQLCPLGIDGLAQRFTAERRGPKGPEPVILKQLLPHYAQERRGAAAWLHNAQDNASLSHPACARVLDWGECDGESYVALERLEAISLHELERARKPASRAGAGARWDVEIACHIGSQVLEALAEAHERTTPILHLDVCPQSVAITEQGAVVLGEFGFWSALDRENAARLRYDHGRVHYLSPELVTVAAPDARSDVFSVGALLFKLLTGEHAFSGSTHMYVAVEISNGRRHRVRDLLPHAPEELCAVVESMLAHEPEHRFRSARAALNALRQAVPISSPPVGALAEIARGAMRADQVHGIEQAETSIDVLRESWASDAKRSDRPAHALAFADDEPSFDPTAALTPAAEPASYDLRAANSDLPMPPPMLGPAEPTAEEPTPPPCLHQVDDPFAVADSRSVKPARAQVRDGQTSFLAVSAQDPALSLREPSFDRERGAEPRRAMPPEASRPGAASAGPRLSASSPEHESFFQRSGSAELRPVEHSGASGFLSPRLASVAPSGAQGTHLSGPNPSWRDPSLTLFQKKSYASKRAHRASVRAPLLLKALLSFTFGFATISALYLLYQLVD